jgi:hypothetical protein
MSWMDQIGNILQQYGGTGFVQSDPPPEVDQHFDQIARSAPQSEIADGLAHAFRSDETPSFPQMVSQLFSQSNSEQRAGLLNQLLAAVGPGALSQLGGLAGLLKGSQTVTPQQARQIPPDAVQELATHAEENRPSIVDQISGFYAQHPDIVKALGGFALAVALRHMARRQG